jgi:hypothetical protein
VYRPNAIKTSSVLIRVVGLLGGVGPSQFVRQRKRSRLFIRRPSCSISSPRLPWVVRTRIHERIYFPGSSRDAFTEFTRAVVVPIQKEDGGHDGLCRLGPFATFCASVLHRAKIGLFGRRQKLLLGLSVEMEEFYKFKDSVRILGFHNLVKGDPHFALHNFCSRING